MLQVLIPESESDVNLPVWSTMSGNLKDAHALALGRKAGVNDRRRPRLARPARPSAAAPEAGARPRDTETAPALAAATAMTKPEPAPTEACPAVAVRVGRFTKNSRLGNVLMFLGSALISAEDEGGSALISRGHVPTNEVYLSKRPPVDMYFNSTRFCVPPFRHFFKTAWAVANNVTSEPDPVLSPTHQATTNCTLGSPGCSGPGCYGSCPSFTCQGKRCRGTFAVTVAASASVSA